MEKALQAEYLQTLGIVQYVSRDAVIEEHKSAGSPSLKAKLAAQPGAFDTEPAQAKSATGESMKGESVTVESVATGQAAGKKSPVAARINIDFESPAQSKKSSKSSAKIAPQPVDQTTAAAGQNRAAELAAELIEVQFSLWQPNAEVLVCSAVEGALADAEQMQLLTNILNALGAAVSRLPQMELVEWPPYANAEGDEKDVREFLSTLLQARLSTRPVTYLLLMGEAAADWLLSAEQRAGSKGYGQLALSAGVTALMVPSLSAMIATPQLKADAWQVLKSVSFAPSSS